MPTPGRLTTLNLWPVLGCYWWCLTPLDKFSGYSIAVWCDQPIPNIPLWLSKPICVTFAAWQWCTFCWRSHSSMCFWSRYLMGLPIHPTLCRYLILTTLKQPLKKSTLKRFLILSPSPSPCPHTLVRQFNHSMQPLAERNHFLPVAS